MSIGPLFGLAASAAVARTASAQESNRGRTDPALSIEAGRCLSGPAVSTGLRAWRGDRPIDERLRFDIVERGDSVAIVVFRDGEKAGAREFEVGGRTCSDVVRMVSLSVAIMIDQALFGAPPPPSQESTPPSPPEEPAKPSPPTAAARPPTDPKASRPRQRTKAPTPRRRALSFGLDAPTPAVALGTLPSHAFGVGGAIVIRLKEHYEGSLSATALRSAITPFGPASLEGRLLAFGLDVCLREPIWQRGIRLHAAACGGITVGALEARPRGFRDAHSATLPYNAATVGLKLLVDLTSTNRVALFASSTLWIPFAAPQFELQPQTGAGGSLLWEPDAVGFLFRVGPEFHF